MIDISARLRENADLDELEHCNPDVVALEREAADTIDQLRTRIAELEEALGSIAKRCQESRSQTRRIRWIEQRATAALTGEPFKEHVYQMPKNGERTAEKVWRENVRLKAHIAELEAQQRAGVPPLSSYSGLIEDAIELISYIDSDSHNPNTVLWARKTETKLRAMLAAAQSHKEQEQAPQPAEVQHVLYTNADADAPDAIKDRHGDVVLGLCKVCGQAEGDLEKQCPGPKKTPAEVGDLDVAALVETLELARNDLSDWITSFPEAAHASTRIVIARIDAALAAYRKGGGV